MSWEDLFDDFLKIVLIVLMAVTRATVWVLFHFWRLFVLLLVFWFQPCSFFFFCSFYKSVQFLPLAVYCIDSVPPRDLYSLVFWLTVATVKWVSQAGCDIGRMASLGDSSKTNSTAGLAVADMVHYAIYCCYSWNWPMGPDLSEEAVSLYWLDTKSGFCRPHFF